MRRALHISWLAAGAVLLSACSGGSRTARSVDGSLEEGPRGVREVDASIRVRMIDATARAAPGMAVVVPVELRSDPGDGRVRVRVEDGRYVEARLWLVRARPAPQGGPVPWLSRSARYEVLGASEVGAIQDGQWYLHLRPPLDSIGQGVWVSGQRLELDWLPMPVATAGRDAWPSPLGASARGSAALRTLLEPALQDPARRWRARLLLDGLNPHVVPAVGQMAHPLLEDLAAQREAAWQVALARVRRDRPELAKRLVQRLARTVEFSSGLRVPAWDDDRLDPDRALEWILSPVRTQRSAWNRLESVLDIQPSAVSWVEGDAPARLGAANLGASATEARVLATGNRAGAPLELPPMTVRHLSAESLGPVRAVRVRVGSSGTDHAVASGTLPATPPGARLGPFVPDWTLAAWLGHERLQPDSRWASGVLVHQDERGRWALLIECRADPDAPTSGDRPDRVQVWVGPRGAPVALIEVDETGAASDRSAPGRVPGRAIEAQSLRARDGWRALVPLPDGVVRDGQTGPLEFGLVRTDRLGRRWCWPRPMFPWQVEPGRVRVDLAAWNTLDRVPSQIEP